MSSLGHEGGQSDSKHRQVCGMASWYRRSSRGREVVVGWGYLYNRTLDINECQKMDE